MKHIMIALITCFAAQTSFAAGSDFDSYRTEFRAKSKAELEHLLQVNRAHSIVRCTTGAIITSVATIASAIPIVSFWTGMAIQVGDTSYSTLDFSGGNTKATVAAGGGILIATAYDFIEATTTLLDEKAKLPNQGKLTWDTAKNSLRGVTLVYENLLGEKSGCVQGLERATAAASLLKENNKKPISALGVASR